MDGENLMFSLFKNSKPVTGDEYNAKTPSSPFRKQWSTSPICRPVDVFAYKRRLFSGMYIDYFLCRIGGSDIGASCLYLVRRVINRGIVEKEAIINNHFERVLDGGLFFSAADVKKLYSMYNSAFLDDLTKAMGRKSFDEDLKALPEKGGYSCLFDVDKFKNINDTFGHLLGDEVLMKVVKILKSQIPVDKGKVYRFGGDEFAVIYTGGTLEELLSILKEIVHFQVEALI